MPSQEMPNPDARTTLVGFETASSLCSSLQPPSYMNGALLRLMQEHFSDAANLLYNGTGEKTKQLEAYTWSANDNDYVDPRNTKIKIQMVTDYDTRDTARNPAIYLKRNKWQTQRVAISDGRSPQVIRNAENKIVEVRGDKYTRQIMGSHTYFAIAKEGAQAELMGNELFDFLVSFAPLIQKDLKLHRFEVNEIDGVGVLEEATDRFVVPVVVAYSFFWTWRLEASAPFLKSIGIDMRP